MATEVVMTRAGQITLTKEIREKLDIHEGDIIIVNAVGTQAIVTKKDPSIFKRVKSFLPKNFETTLKQIRAKGRGRLTRLGIVE